MAKGQVLVSPGLAIDVCGREIVVAQPLSLRLEPRRNTHAWVGDLTIEWHETADSPVPSRNGATDFARWVEEPELSLIDSLKGPSEALVLARLTRTSRGTVEVDSSVRRPLGLT